jgi:hypothetical protein
MASASQGKGGIRPKEWWKHLRWRKKCHQKTVRQDGKRQLREDAARA